MASLGRTSSKMLGNANKNGKQDLDLNDMWFQQDCATCHIAWVTMDLLRDEFGENCISRSGSVNWPCRS